MKNPGERISKEQSDLSSFQCQKSDDISLAEKKTFPCPTEFKKSGISKIATMLKYVLK